VATSDVKFVSCGFTIEAAAFDSRIGNPSIEAAYLDVATSDVKFVSYGFTIEAAGIGHSIGVPSIEAACIDRGNQRRQIHVL
jgi:hypothetical protein